MALYALDVYYSQQFGPDISFIPEDSHHYSRIDYQGVGNSYNNYPYGSIQNAHENQIPYYDQFHQTYRRFSSGWKDLDKIINWIEIAKEM